MRHRRAPRRAVHPLLIIPIAVMLATTPSAVSASPPIDDLNQGVGTTRILSKRSDGSFGTELSGDPSMSGNGRFVAFYSEDRRLLGDPVPCCQVYMRDRATGVTKLVSVNQDGDPADHGGANGPSLSHDGGTLAFASSAENLVPDETDGFRNVYLRDADTGEITLITKGRGDEPANGDSFLPSLSADGTRVTFSSDASNLARGDTNAITDTFVYDKQTGTTTLVSRGRNGKSAQGQSLLASISADGSRVAYFSTADNIAGRDTNFAEDVFVYDIASGDSRLVSRTRDGVAANNPSVNPTLSGDGSLVAFWSFATDLAPRDTNGAGDAFVRDLDRHRTRMISRNRDGESGSGESDDPVVSADGSIIAFQSFAGDLVRGDTNDSVDIFVYDVGTRSLELITRDRDGGPADGPSFIPSPSANGSLIAFESVAGDLVPGDTNDKTDVFVYRRF